MFVCVCVREATQGGQQGAAEAEDIFDLLGLQRDGSVLARAVAVGLGHHQDQVTVRDLLHHEHPEPIREQREAPRQRYTHTHNELINQLIETNYHHQNKY